MIISLESSLQVFLYVRCKLFKDIYTTSPKYFRIYFFGNTWNIYMKFNYIHVSTSFKRLVSYRLLFSDHNIIKFEVNYKQKTRGKNLTCLEIKKHIFKSHGLNNKSAEIQKYLEFYNNSRTVCRIQSSLEVLLCQWEIYTFMFLLHK